MLLDVMVTEEAGWQVIAVVGDVDLASVPRVRSAVVGAVQQGATRLVVDLSGVDLLDSAGLGVLVGARRRVRSVDPAGEVRLVAPSDPVRRTLELSGLAEIFDVFASRGEALAPTREVSGRDG